MGHFMGAYKGCYSYAEAVEMNSYPVKELAIRLEGVTNDSPLAVFKTKRKGHYRVVFYNTVKTREEILKNIRSFVGIVEDIQSAKELVSDLMDLK